MILFTYGNSTLFPTGFYMAAPVSCRTIHPSKIDHILFPQKNSIIIKNIKFL